MRLSPDRRGDGNQHLVEFGYFLRLSCGLWLQPRSRQAQLPGRHPEYNGPNSDGAEGNPNR